MKKVYIKQFFCDGFGKYLFIKPISYIKRKIKNKKIVNFLTILVALIYLVIMILIAKILFDLNYPF